MSSAQDFIARFGGTTGVPDGGESLVKNLFKRTMTFTVAAFEADDNTNRHVLWKNATDINLRVVGVEYIPDAAVTASDTNFSEINVYHEATPASGTDKLAATLSTTVAGPGDFVADTPEALNLSATEANKILEPDEYLVIEFDGTAGLGVDLPTARVIVTYEVA